MQLPLLKIFSTVRRDEETFVLILPCSCTENSHLALRLWMLGGGQNFLLPRSNGVKVNSLKSLHLGLNSRFSMAAQSADHTAATSADFKASAGNHDVAYNPQSVWDKGMETPVKVNGHVLNRCTCLWETSTCAQLFGEEFASRGSLRLENQPKGDFR